MVTFGKIIPRCIRIISLSILDYTYHTLYKSKLGHLLPPQVKLTYRGEGVKYIGLFLTPGKKKI